MTTVWHADPDLLRAYAAGLLDPARATSVEQHVQRCEVCRGGIAVHADRELLAGVWDDVVDRLDQPALSWAERAAIRVGARPDLTRLVFGAAAARRAVTAALVLVAGFAAVVPGFEDSWRLWFLVVAPLIPVAAVGAAYGPGVDPMFEVIAAGPFPVLRLVLLRCLLVVPVGAVLTVLGGALLPGGWAVGVLWLLPAVGLALLTLALEPRFGARPVTAAVTAAWIAVVAGTYRATGSVLPVFAPTGQLVFAVVAVAAAVVVARGRLESWGA